MSIRWIAGLLIVCMSCHSGVIPCPKIKTVKLHRNFRPSAASLSAKATQEEPETPHQRYKDVRTNEGHFVKNISVEEWDCPRPGAKRYLPKSVKDNIKKNKKKFEEDVKNQTDSLSVNR